MKLASGLDLAVQMIQTLYSAETQLVIALPLVAARAQATELREAIELHLEQTRAHAQRLEDVARRMGVPCRGRACYAMEGLLKDGNEMMGFGGDGHLVDAAIIAVCRAVEHYEIAAYEALLATGDPQIEDTIGPTLQEEAETLRTLAELQAQTRAPSAG